MQLGSDALRHRDTVALNRVVAHDYVFTQGSTAKVQTRQARAQATAKTADRLDTLATALGGTGAIE